jgi:1-acyl-sn-glycerol-3-phosphate acyltransferase
MRHATTLTRAAARRLGAREIGRLSRIEVRDAGHGYDVFGMHRDWVAVALLSTRFLHRRWFRVTSHGAENIPRSGPAILAANHAGVVPLDAAMIYADVVEHTDPPRVPRPVADHFVPALPFVSTFFARTGVVAGTRGNASRLLDDGELLLIFPEGTPGMDKPRSERYRLQRFRVGHAELAMRHHAPVIPVAVIGAEEQWPLLARIRWLHPFGAPFLPIPATPLPLPVRIHIHYGAPIELAGDAGDPAAVAEGADRVRAAVARLIDQGLRARKGLFS